MPNPNFTGNVPHRRCETCKFWRRLRETVAAGDCSVNSAVNVNYISYAEAQAGATDKPIQWVDRILTTDLSVCSNWDGKTE